MCLKICCPGSICWLKLDWVFLKEKKNWTDGVWSNNNKLATLLRLKSEHVLSIDRTNWNWHQRAGCRSCWLLGAATNITSDLYLCAANTENKDRHRYITIHACQRRQSRTQDKWPPPKILVKWLSWSSNSGCLTCISLHQSLPTSFSADVSS